MALTLRSYDLIDLATVKDYLGISGTSDDEILKLLIMAATDYIEGQLVGVDDMDGGYCNRRFKETTYTSAKYTGHNFEDLFLRQYPITAVTTIVIDDTTEFPSGSSTLNELDFYIDNEAVGNLKYTSVWPAGDPQNIAITYTAGYATIPFDLQLVATALVVLRFNSIGKEPYKSEKIGNYSYTLKDLLQDNPFGDGTIKDMVDQHRKPVF